MNLKITFSFWAICICLSSFSQTFKGKICDTQNNPIPYVNVVLLSAQDSTFINGTVTDDDGNFTVKPNGHGTALSYAIRCSFIRYQSQTLKANRPDLGVIVLSDAAHELKEVVVKGTKPIYKMEADGLKTVIANTLLSRLGTANDVLGQLPFVTGEEGKFTVFGRGEPLIYINNKLMRNKEELRQIKSSEIKDVKVIFNPGAQYDATVSAVIKITTTKAVGEGLSGTFYAYANQKRKFSHYESAKLNYRKEGLDLFVGGDFNKNEGLSYQTDDISLKVKNDSHIVKQEVALGWVGKGYSINTGFNYAFNPKHTVGARYDYSRTPSEIATINGLTNHYLNDANDYNINLDTRMGNPSQKHYINTYYHGELNENTEIHFDGDYVNGGGNVYQTTVNSDVLTGDRTEVETRSSNKYLLYAAKMWLSMKVLSGKLTLGSEASYTENNQEYKMLNEEIEKDLPSNYNSSDQSLFAGFLTYDKNFGKLSLQAGLRYEYIDFRYFYMGKLMEGQSPTYNNLFPTASVSYNGEKVNMSLSYRSTTRRPSYNQLRSSISYYDPYTYEGGNPALRPMFIHRLTYLFGWKDIQFQTSYAWYKDNIFITAEQFKDRPVMIFKSLNLERSGQFEVGIGYSPQIGFWKPTFELGMVQQNFTYNQTQYNKPLYSYRWNNMITLPYDYLLFVNMWGNTRGHNDITYTDTSFRTDVWLNKKFLKNQLNVSVAFTDIFRSNREKWDTRVGDVYFYKWNRSDSRGVYLQATYTFNTTRSKYKGGQAATDEINRL